MKFPVTTKMLLICLIMVYLHS